MVALGTKSARPLADHLDLHTVADLLMHLPRRYLDPAQLTDLSTLPVGERVSVLLQVEQLEQIPYRDGSGFRVQVTASDAVGRIRMVFFYKTKRKEGHKGGKRGWVGLHGGMRALFDGVVARSKIDGALELHHPKHIKVFGGMDVAELLAQHSTRLIPIYPLSGTLATDTVQRSVQQVLDVLGEVPDPVPADVLASRGLVDLHTALEYVHRPADRGQVTRGQARLRFDEAFVLQVILAQRRVRLHALPARARPGRAGGVLDRFDSRLAFDLTGAQRRVGEQIRVDLAQSAPMHRLLQGDVGSGKTLVALRAMLQVVDSGGQAALLAPTEVLAHQHYRTLLAFLGSMADEGLLADPEAGTAVRIITGSQGSRQRRDALEAVADGTAGIIVGTHALLEDTVAYADLGLVVVDEQHRFGVEQRAALAGRSSDGARPHVLVMTATPIPRTVAMTVFGDLDVSVLDEAPPGRQQIATHVVVPEEKPHFLARIWQRITEEVAAGRKAYVVCPRIGDDEATVAADEAGSSGPESSGPESSGPGSSGSESSESRTVSAVLDTVTDLEQRYLPHLRIGMLHGRMSSEAKDEAMRRFSLPHSDERALDVVVATTVIEVGIDVPSASTMVILDADRFGISQLHQLRGRVGRGGDPGLCLLVTSARAGSPARQRLAAVAATTDGFELARADLEARAEGDVLGAAQSGRRTSLALLRVVRDEDIVVDARDVATALVEADPELARHPALLAATERRLADDRSEFLAKD
jgi:ATP-dependent DNA helicase RecG